MLNAHQNRCGVFSVKNPCATSQIGSGIPDASSKISSTPSLLCKPAYASGFSSDHSLPSTDQKRVPFFKSRSTISASHFAGVTRVALISNQWLLIIIASHLVISDQVIERSCASLLADTIVVLPIRVDSIHSTSQLTSADLPIPRPEATASRKTL